MRKVAKHHISVTKKTYDTVFVRDMGRCALCCDDRIENLHLHHIKTRSHKALINDPDNCIMLCSAHHRIVHQDMNYWEPILQGIVERRKKWQKDVCSPRP